MTSSTSFGELSGSGHVTVEPFVSRWQQSAASERANYQLFLVELCELLGFPRPEPATRETERDEYVFERPVSFHNLDGTNLSSETSICNSAML